MPTLPPQLEKFMSDVERKLNEPGTMTNVLARIESKTGVKRSHILGGFLNNIIYNTVFTNMKKPRNYTALCILFAFWAMGSVGMQSYRLPLSSVSKFAN
jgi:hypothetical protein